LLVVHYRLMLVRFRLSDKVEFLLNGRTAYRPRYFVALWRGSRINTSDRSGNNNNGTLKPIGSEPTWDIGSKLCNALSFDGTDDYGDCNNNVGNFYLLDLFTIEAWINSKLDNSDEVILWQCLSWTGIAGEGHIRKQSEIYAHWNWKHLQGNWVFSTDCWMASYRCSMWWDRPKNIYRWYRWLPNRNGKRNSNYKNDYYKYKGWLGYDFCGSLFQRLNQRSLYLG